jgi:hypothetical protein
MRGDTLHHVIRWNVEILTTRENAGRNMLSTGIAQITHFHVLQLLPNPLSGIPERAYLPFMNRRAIPDHQQAVQHVRQQMLEKNHTIQAIECLIAHHRVQSAIHSDPAHHQQVIACIWPPQDRCLSEGCICSDVSRQEIKPCLVHKHDGPAFDMRLFLSWGQTCRRHCSIAALLRWVARLIGICGVQCQRFNNRETWALWYQAPNSSPITVATRAHVQHSPRKPYASAPWDKSSGIKRHWPPVSLIGPVGLGLARHSSTPCSRVCASHWLTAPALTPSASAICRWGHPCCLRCQACNRRASFQRWGFGFMHGSISPKAPTR